MIPFSSQRGLGQDLATHLLNEHDNEVMELVEIRGAIADDLHGAFAEWELQAKYLTKCQRYLYSLSINPDPRQEALTQEQYFDYIDRIEEKLGLSGQPRAVVFHTKHGRNHAHVVWSRIDLSQEKAIQLSHDRPKLMDVTREFARDHGLELPDGYFKDNNNNEKSSQNSLYEQYQQNATGLTKKQHMEQVTEAWMHSDNAKSFVNALREKGYILATGKRPYVLVDIYGGMNALSKLISDKKIRTKDVRAFLEKDFPINKLPTVEQARAEVAQQRQAMDERREEQAYDDKLDQLAHAQADRRASLASQLGKLKKQQGEENQNLQHKHTKESLAHKQDYLRAQKAIRAKRLAARPTGLAEFLGRITGVNLVRKKIHAYQDKKTHIAYKEQRDKIDQSQRQHKEELVQRHVLQRADAERKLRSLDKVERRENKSLALVLIREERIRERAGHEHMQPIRIRTAYDKSQDNQDQDIPNTAYRGEPLGIAFSRGKEAKVPLALGLKLKEAFTSASDTGDKTDDGRGDATGTPSPTTRRKEDEQPRLSRKRGKGKDRGR